VRSLDRPSFVAYIAMPAREQEADESRDHHDRGVFRDAGAADDAAGGIESSGSAES
jgi:hypothetical protein